MKPLSAEWIEKAEGDFRVAGDQWTRPDPVYDAICFHAQQCAEKYMKAWLLERDVDFPKVHDIETLAKLCQPALAEVPSLMDAFRFLTSVV